MKDLLKKSNYFNKNRVIILSVLSIFLVITLLLGSTYSLFSATNIDEDLHVYTTGNLNITYTLSEDNIIFDKPTTYSIKESSNVVPYRITINKTR